MLTRWRRPNKVRFPGGFEVPVVYWSQRKIRADVKNDPEGKDLLGYWDGTKIVISSSQPLWIQIEVLGHELVHAAHDYALWLKQRYADPIKQEAGETAMETAIE